MPHPRRGAAVAGRGPGPRSGWRPSPALGGPPALASPFGAGGRPFWPRPWEEPRYILEFAGELPAFLAEGWLAVSQRIGRHPTIDYANCVLYNWQRVEENAPITPELELTSALNSSSGIAATKS